MHTLLIPPKPESTQCVPSHREAHIFERAPNASPNVSSTVCCAPSISVLLDPRVWPRGCAGEQGAAAGASAGDLEAAEAEAGTLEVVG